MNREIERKLKLRGEPIRLFAETDRQRMKRLKLLESREEDRSGGQRNDFNELLLQQDSEEPVEVKRQKQQSIDRISDLKDVLINRELLIKDQRRTRELIETFFQVLLREWQFDLDSRTDEMRKSASGRIASATFEQAKEHLKPFFRMLKKDELPADILAHITDIVGFLQQKEYIRASDTYLRLSIGNAPWPIGVTMVGIHERSAHEKINSGSVAHALNDEVTRKWIQSVKRLMTFCQKIYPPTDLSKAMG
jgi:pre-mRNA-splicing factor 18